MTRVIKAIIIIMSTSSCAKEANDTHYSDQISARNHIETTIIKLILSLHA